MVRNRQRKEKFMVTGKIPGGKPFLDIVLVAAAFVVTTFLPLRADTYQYIVTPGYDPDVAATNRCGIASSAASSLATGAVPVSGVASGETSSRYRTSDGSNASRLNALKWRYFGISFR